MLSTQLMILNYPHPCHKFYVVNCFENEGFFLRKKNKKKENYSTSFNIIIKSFKEIVIVDLIVSIALQYSTLLVFKLLM